MLYTLQTIARRAGDIMLGSVRPEVIQKEGHYNFVTQTDLAVQEYLKGELLALLPGSRLFAEEQENQRLTNHPTWVVDPIDGTINFMRGRGCSAVSIALLQDARPVLGVVFNPYTDEMFTAILGQGAWLNDRAIHVSDLPMDRALVTFGTAPYDEGLARKSMRAAYEALRVCGDLRRTGSAALDLCWVACGRSELYFEFLVSPWDYAAGALIVQEAGGLIRQPLDDAMDYGRAGCLLASNHACEAQALAIVRAAAQDEGPVV